MKKGSTTKTRLDPVKPPAADWSAFDAMSEAERHAAATSDPDCPPLTEARVKQMRRVASIARVRRKLGLTQEQFAARFGLSLGTIRDWEQGAHRPDRAAQLLIRLIEMDPDIVAKASAEMAAE